MSTVAVGIIKVFEGPLHDRLRKIWKKLETMPNPFEWKIHWFENFDMQCHGAMLQTMWETLRKLDSRYILLTEHDFLPGPAFPGIGQFELYPPDTAVLAAEYCTRNAQTYKLEEHGIPGAWYILIDKERLGERKLDFTAGGPFNDPAAKLPPGTTAVIKSYDCMPHHYGVRVGQVGEHLFWSRHYNDIPWKDVAGFPLWDVLARVRRTISAYEETKLCPATS